MYSLFKRKRLELLWVEFLTLVLVQAEMIWMKMPFWMRSLSLYRQKPRRNCLESIQKWLPKIVQDLLLKQNLNKMAARNFRSTPRIRRVVELNLLCLVDRASPQTVEIGLKSLKNRRLVTAIRLLNRVPDLVLEPIALLAPHLAPRRGTTKSIWVKLINKRLTEVILEMDRSKHSSTFSSLLQIWLDKTCKISCSMLIPRKGSWADALPITNRKHPTIQGLQYCQNHMCTLIWKFTAMKWRVWSAKKRWSSKTITLSRKWTSLIHISTIRDSRCTLKNLNRLVRWILRMQWFSVLGNSNYCTTKWED